jgi:hypothetical protein
MVVKRQDVDDDWPDELWYFDRSGFQCRHQWLCACMDYAKANGYNRALLPINRLMINRRAAGTELAMELTPECRQRVTRRRSGWAGV